MVQSFPQTVEQIADADFRDWFRQAISSTDELDYAEALDWYGLHFATTNGAAARWKLEF